MRLMFFIAVLLSLPVHAAEASSYYAAAISAARAEKSANGYASACQAGLTLGGYLETGTPAVRTLHRAIDDCRAALRIDPHHLSARISYGIALSFEGKRTHRPALARLAKDMFESLVAEQPDNPLAHAALADWHAHVSAAGLFARLSLGASRGRAREEFAASFALGKPGKALMLEYIKFLARDGHEDRARALDALALYHTLPPAPGPLNSLLDDRAAALETALRGGHKKVIKKAVAFATAFDDIRDWRELKPLTPEDVAY